MSELLVFGLPFAIGWLAFCCADPLRGLASGPRWAPWVLRGGFAWVAGSGCTSISFLFLRMAGVSRPSWIIAADGACAAVLGLAWRCLRRPRSLSRDGGTSRARGSWFLVAAFVMVLIPCGIRLCQIAWANPQGEWDAWANWNKRAKFLAASSDWRDAASPLMGETHPEYPMLLPCFVARGWMIEGNTAPLIPILTGLLFFAAMVAMLVGTLAILRGTAAAMIGGMILLSAHALLFWVPSQYADVPLASLILATLALLALDSANPSQRSPALVLAGLCAGFAAWMKLEGGPFAVAILLAFLPASRLAAGAWGPSMKRWRALLAGAAPVLLLAIWFTKWIAPPGSDSPRTLSEALSLMAEPGRYGTVIGSFFAEIRNLASGPGHPLIMVALLAVMLGREADRRRAAAAWTGAAALSLLLIADLMAYVTSPLDLTWHIHYSMDRLVLQVWPASVLLLCLFLRVHVDDLLRWD